MLAPLILIFLVRSCTSFNTSFVDFGDLPKCCDFGSVYVKANDSYICRQTENARVDIQTNFVLNQSGLLEAECVESVDLKLYLFSVKNNNSVIKGDISHKMLPKCCPVGFLYAPTTHSCVNNKTHNHQLNATFVKIGLPKCKIIFDYKFQSKEDIDTDSSEEYCVDETTDNTFVARVCEDYSFCRKARCIRKCCPDGQSFVNGSHCETTYVHGMHLEKLSAFIRNVTSEFAIVHGYNTGVFIPNNYNFHLDERGYFHTFEDKIGNDLYSPEEETYCIEHATKGGIVYGHTFFRIIPNTYLEDKFIFNRWAMVISSMFLVLTITFYVFSKETAKAFGKALICFCTSLLILFIILIYCTFKPRLNVRRTMTTCKTIGFLLIYSSFSCFVWLQIMCYDIFWTFGSSKGCLTRSEKKRRDLKKSLYYCLYGWGLPLLMTLILLVFHFVDVLPAPIKIKIGETKCLIDRGEGNYAEILFYISPITVIQVINLVFFVKTVRYCLRVKSDIQRMNQSTDKQKKKNKFLAQKERLGLIIKLSVIMGISFLFEVVSSFYDFKENAVTKYIEIIWDLFNCLQGLFIFIIFICKKKNLKKCQSKMAFDKMRKISLTSSSTKMTDVSSVRKSSQDNRRKCSREEAKNKFA